MQSRQPEEVAKSIETFLVSHYPNDTELGDIQQQFEDNARDPNLTADDFDNVLSDFYDWADDEHRCWIKTF